MSASRSMGTFLSRCKKKGADLETFLGSLGADHEISNEDITIIKKLRKALEEKFDYMDDRWNVLNSTNPDPFKDETEFKKCQKDHEEAEIIKDKMMEAAKRTLDRAPTTGEASASIQEAITTAKIDELLKPKELLSSEMTLEEADQWFESYKAFISYNKRSMTKMDISVKRALLNKCLDTKLVSALRTHKDVTPTTEIDAPSAGCLAKLREIFLEKNPLWLRRHRYFQCTQVKSETVEEWWARKLDKARECRLNEITPDEIAMLELIRGIDSQKLRQEFLRQKEPPLKGLL